MIAVTSTTSLIVLWFCMVHHELQSKMDIVNSAVSQMTACRKNHILTRGGSEEEDAKSILSRSLDIYHQSLMLYNQTLLKPQNRIPGFFMGFRQIREEENT